MNPDTPRLAGACVLVVEDDYFLASDLQDAFETAGATVLGPCPDEASARALLAETRPDCAFVDVNLGHGPSFVVPRMLQGMAVPFAFVTGYDGHIIPEEFAGIQRCEKPVAARLAVEAAARLAGRSG